MMFSSMGSGWQRMEEEINSHPEAHDLMFLSFIQAAQDLKRKKINYWPPVRKMEAFQNPPLGPNKKKEKIIMWWILRMGEETGTAGD